MQADAEETQEAQLSKLRLIGFAAALLIIFAAAQPSANAQPSAITETCAAGIETQQVRLSATYTNTTENTIAVYFTAEGFQSNLRTVGPGQTSGTLFADLGESSSGGTATFMVANTQDPSGTYSPGGTASYDALDCGEPEEPETNTLPLHNDDGSVGNDCPDDTAQDYFHFVLTPNNGSSAFVSITLNLDGDVVTFTGSEIIKNGTQADNVFVAVPEGYEIDDLDLNGSSAEVTGPATKFVLSHVCDNGGGSTTTTTTSTTQPNNTTTTSTTVQGGSTTTTLVGGTSTSAPTRVGGNTDVRGEQLARTGSGNTLMTGVAFVVIGVGIFAVTEGERKRRGARRA